MLVTRIRNLWERHILTLALLGLAAVLSSCASRTPQTALISDPDARPSTSIPWNKPQNWEGRGNIPGGLSPDNPLSGVGGTGGY